MSSASTESIDPRLLDLDLQPNAQIFNELLLSQQQAVDAVTRAKASIDVAVNQATQRLSSTQGRLILIGAGASGRLAVQDGAELWPTFGWPEERLMLCMAGGPAALLASVEGVEDDVFSATAAAEYANVNAQDVVIAVAASGRSAWTCAWLETARGLGALSIGIANNANTRLLNSAECPVLLDSGAEVLAGSTRMAAGTAQKIALNIISTTLMIRLNRTYGNLMVDMAAVNQKLDSRRIRLLQRVLPELDDIQAQSAITAADGWVKLAVLIAMGDSAQSGEQRLVRHAGSLRRAMAECGHPSN